MAQLRVHWPRAWLQLPRNSSSSAACGSYINHQYSPLFNNVPSYSSSMYFPLISHSRQAKRRVSVIADSDSDSISGLSTPTASIDAASLSLQTPRTPQPLSSDPPQIPEVVALNFTGYTNAVFYPDWACNLTPPQQAIPFENVTHIYYTFIGLNEDGSVFLTEPDTNGNTGSSLLTTKSCVRQLKEGRNKRNSNAKLLMSVGGGIGSTNFSSVVSHSESRERLVLNLKNIIDEYSFDGLDGMIDFSKLNSSTMLTRACS